MSEQCDASVLHATDRRSGQGSEASLSREKDLRASSARREAQAALGLPQDTVQDAIEKTLGDDDGCFGRPESIPERVLESARLRPETASWSTKCD